MRETGPARKSSDGDPAASSAQMGAARTQLGILKNLMALGGLPSGARTVRFEDGTEIRVTSINGQDSISIVTATAGIEPPPEQAIPELAPIDVAEVQSTTGIGVRAFYSQPYLSSVLKGAIMDKTATITYMAYSPIAVDQSYSQYQPVASGYPPGVLVSFDEKLNETGRGTVMLPDWGGQFTYDFVTDCFFLNTWFAQDPAFLHQATRWLTQISKTGAQTTLGGQQAEADLADLPTALWGQAQFLQGPFEFLFQTGTPLNYTFQANAPGGAARGGGASERRSFTFPMSQPSTSGLIAAMFQGNTSKYVGFTCSDRDAAGFAFLWDTRTQSIVWRGDAHGTFNGRFFEDYGTNFYDPWATVTPQGNAIFSVMGKCFVQNSGTGPTVTAPPDGTLSCAVTRGDKFGFAATASSLFAYSATRGWHPLSTPAGKRPLSVLHDLVTDAVAVVFDDASGAMIYNGKSAAGDVLQPFWAPFKDAPTSDPLMIYPQQFINGAILVTYALPFTGGFPAGTTDNIPVFEVSPGGDPFLFLPGPYGMPQYCLPDPTGVGLPFNGTPGVPAWRAQLKRPPAVMVDGFASFKGSVAKLLSSSDAPQCTRYAAVNECPWIIGRYDIDALKT